MIRTLVAGFSAAMLLGSLGGTGANATPLPNLTNLNFEQYTGANPKAAFTAVDPVGWTGGNGLIYIDGQDFANSAAGPIYLQTYANPVGNIVGNYVEADGNPTYESGFSYMVNGLTPGETYSLSFYQGASAQTGFGASNQPTTNQWIVSLGTQGMQVDYNAGPIDPVYGQTSTYFNNDSNASIAASPLMVVPNGKAVGWDYVTVNLKADATSDLLSFLAWGDNGSTVNLPPIAFLAGVNSPPGLGVGGAPEPGAWALMFLGVFATGMALRRHRTRTASTLAAT